MWDTISEYLTDIVNALMAVLIYIPNLFLEWIIEFCVDILASILEALGPELPDGSIEMILKTFVWLEYIDSIFPLSYGITLLTTYYMLRMVLLVIKYVLKLIPGIWG